MAESSCTTVHDLFSFHINVLVIAGVLQCCCTVHPIPDCTTLVWKLMQMLVNSCIVSVAHHCLLTFWFHNAVITAAVSSKPDMECAVIAWRVPNADRMASWASVWHRSNQKTAGFEQRFAVCKSVALTTELRLQHIRPEQSDYILSDHPQ